MTTKKRATSHGGHGMSKASQAVPFKWDMPRKPKIICGILIGPNP